MTSRVLVAPRRTRAPIRELLSPGATLAARCLRAIRRQFYQRVHQRVHRRMSIDRSAEDSGSLTTSNNFRALGRINDSVALICHHFAYICLALLGFLRRKKKKRGEWKETCLPIVIGINCITCYCSQDIVDSCRADFYSMRAFSKTHDNTD